MLCSLRDPCTLSPAHGSAVRATDGTCAALCLQPAAGAAPGRPQRPPEPEPAVPAAPAATFLPGSCLFWSSGGRGDRGCAAHVTPHVSLGEKVVYLLLFFFLFLCGATCGRCPSKSYPSTIFIGSHVLSTAALWNFYCSILVGHQGAAQR